MSNCDNFILNSKESGTNGEDVKYTLIQKLSRFNEIIQSTYTYITNNKRGSVVKGIDLKSCILELRTSRKTVSSIYNDIVGKNTIDYEDVIKHVQKLNTDLSNIMKKWGTYNFEDFLYICFGKDYHSLILNDTPMGLVTMLEKQFHPLKYIMFSLEGSPDTFIGSKESVIDYKLSEALKMKTFDCFDVAYKSGLNSLFVQVNSVVVYIKNPKMNAGMFVFGIIDNMDIELVNSSFINDKYRHAINNVPSEINTEILKNLLQCITIKDWVIFKNSSDIYNHFLGGIEELHVFKQQSLVSMSTEFINRPLFLKRQILLFLLLSDQEVNNKYISYFLYDLLTADSNGNTDSHEQMELMDSFTWKMQELFNNALVETVQYTNKVNKLDASKINVEQQICLMNTDDTVKEKAMVKLREAKSKSDDGGSKPRQYIDGLLKIPFGMYVKEPIMESDVKIKALFNNIVPSETMKSLLESSSKIKSVDKVTTMDIKYLVKTIENTYVGIQESDAVDKIIPYIKSKDKKYAVSYIERLNNLISKEGNSLSSLSEPVKEIDVVKKTKNVITGEVQALIQTVLKSKKEECIPFLRKMRSMLYPDFLSISDTVENINKVYANMNDYIFNVEKVLDQSVYGHKLAKTQILRIIGQWINGEQTGYCFGFEGPPGVGKTSLCKTGLANCLINDKGVSRPFAMIAMGGDANGSTLHGHNYTYVGSTWGAIIQILMDKKCMNPIIFIDELDKVSRTEHGREIIGILTHMLDPTQNEKFQDKYFSGIDFDLSKVLFILSYNDAELIDRILLDRIHRIKFSNLSLDEKIYIAKTYTLPEIYTKTGLEGAINIDDEAIRFVVDKYTCEPGVRKLKEKLFEIVTDINLTIIKSDEQIDYPINVTIDEIKNKYFKDHHPIRTVMVPTESRVGYANGLWANSMGQGGTLPVEAHFHPSNEFLKLKLTGKQGDVMQESMNVALTLAYKMSDPDILDTIVAKYNGSIKYGIHVHTPEGATPKDGPSAGSCITIVLYSLLNNKKIKAQCGMTGEIQLNGSITAIGGLDLKILGSLKSGIVQYFFPTENQSDFDKFFEKYKDKEEIKGVEFFPVSHIEQLMDKIIEKEE